MTDSPRPAHAYPFTLEQITGARPAPPHPGAEEEMKQWEELPELDEASEGEGWEYTFATLYADALGHTYPARAHYLQSHEVTPLSLAETCASPQRMRLFLTPEDLDAQGVESQAAYLNEVAAYFAYWGNQVMERRNRHIVRLRELGWGMPQIASLLGLSKQRVHAILESTESDSGETVRVSNFAPEEVGQKQKTQGADAGPVAEV